MLFSLNLLKKLVNIGDIEVEDLVNKLVGAGFEVEGYKSVASASKLVIGHVLSCLPHPDSDHLHVLKVDCGQEGVLDIVCGAPNVAKDQKVIVALVGCVLPAIGETIKAGNIRGAESNGMCCSLSELGVDKSAQSEENLKGIHVLDKNAKVGEKNVLGYLGLDDVILDVSILPNRPDCLSHLGFARELKSILNTSMVSYKLPVLPSKKSKYSVESVTPNCDKFSLLEVELDGGKTPEEIKRTLLGLKIRSISPAVDLGNYSMILTGQPLHMYDLDKVKGNKLVISEDKSGPFTALDDKEYQFINGDIVISDEDKVCCLGGVMGSKAVAISSSSKHIGIEAAHFYYASIRHTSSRLGLVSDSSSLFSKGTNPYLVDEALKVTLNLAGEFFSKLEVVGLSTFDKVKSFDGKYPFSLDVLNKHLGTGFTMDEISTDFTRLGLTYKDGFILKDIRRLDLLEQCDIEEEIFRLEPRSRINLSIDRMSITSGCLTSNQESEKRIKENLVANGLNQIITYTLLSDKLDKLGRVFDNKPSFKVNHPLTEDHEYVRSDLVSSMISAITYNLAHKNENLSLFEISHIDTPTGNKEYLSIGLKGVELTRGLVSPITYDFFYLKGLIVDVLSILGLDERRYSLVRSKNSFFHPGKSADIMIGKTLVGTFGEISPVTKLPSMLIAELDLSFLMSQKSSKTKAASLLSIAPIRRDLAFKLLDAEVQAEDIIKAIKKAGGKYVLSSEVFDIFNKDGETYYGFATFFSKEDKPFTDAEINSLLNTIILSVTHSLKVQLRS